MSWLRNRLRAWLCPELDEDLSEPEEDEAREIVYALLCREHFRREQEEWDAQQRKLH